MSVLSRTAGHEIKNKGSGIMANLTPKQERFCEKYAARGNATQAAIRAGYSAKTAYSIGQENLKKPEIIARIHELQARDKKKRIMNIDERQAKLTEIAENSIDENAAIRAIETLNKMDGLYVQKHEVQVTRSLADIIREIDENADRG